MSGPAASPGRDRAEASDAGGATTLVQRLVRDRLPILVRSIRYHRPRAPFCGIGACSQCLVAVNGQPNVRACRYQPLSNDRLSTMNAWPTPSVDALGILDVLFYRGIDTLHGFRRPRWATPLYQCVVRRLAGYGPLPAAAPPGRAAGQSVTTDVAVIGGGASGRACASRLAAGGRRVHLLERTLRGEAPAKVETALGFTAVFLPPPADGSGARFTLLASAEDGRGLSVRANAVVVASGGYDAGLLFDGNDRPGVVTAEGAEAFARPGGSPPFRRAVVVGGGTRAGEILDRFGPAVEAVVAPGSIVPEVADRAAQLDVPLYPRTLLLASRGRGRVRGALLRSRGDGRAFSVPADAIVLAHRRLPNPQLFFQAGARMEFRAGTGAYYPALVRGQETSVPGLFAVGEAAGFVEPAVARTSGEAAADQILGGEPARPGPRVDAEKAGEMPGYLRELLPHLLERRRPILCACEDVLLSELTEAHRAGYRGVEVVKRYTGLGTGLCQGRYCLPDALLLLAQLEERPPSEVGYITQRPPVFPARLDALSAIPDPEEAAVP